MTGGAAHALSVCLVIVSCGLLFTTLMLVMLSVRHAGCRNLWAKDHRTVREMPVESSGNGRLEPLQDTATDSQDHVVRLETSTNTGQQSGEARKDTDPSEQPSEDYQALGRHVST